MSRRSGCSVATPLWRPFVLSTTGRRDMVAAVTSPRRPHRTISNTLSVGFIVKIGRCHRSKLPVLTENCVPDRVVKGSALVRPRLTVVRLFDIAAAAEQLPHSEVVVPRRPFDSIDLGQLGEQVTTSTIASRACRFPCLGLSLRPGDRTSACRHRDRIGGRFQRTVRRGRSRKCALCCCRSSLRRLVASRRGARPGTHRDRATLRP